MKQNSSGDASVCLLALLQIPVSSPFSSPWPLQPSASCGCTSRSPRHVAESSFSTTVEPGRSQFPALRVSVRRHVGNTQLGGALVKISGCTDRLRWVRIFGLFLFFPTFRILPFLLPFFNCNLGSGQRFLFLFFLSSSLAAGATEAAAASGADSSSIASSSESFPPFRFTRLSRYHQNQNTVSTLLSILPP